MSIEEMKDSAIGKIPIEWDVKSLGECVEFWDGKRVPLKQEDRDTMQGDYPYYGASGIIDYVDSYLFDDDLILVGEDGENVVSRNSPLAFQVSGEIWVNNHAHVLKPKENHNIGFLTQRLEFHDYSLLVSGSAQPKLNQRNLKGLQLAVPPEPEQAKIAEILSTVDRAIEQTEAAIAKQQRIKTGLMQDLLTRGIDEHGNLRSAQTHQFKDSPLGRIPVEWEVEYLERLTKRIVDGVHHTPTYVDSGIPFIVVTDLTAGSGIDFSKTRFVSEKDHHQFIKRANPQSGDVLVTKDGTLGVARIVKEGLPEFSIFVSVAMLRPRLDICLPELIWSFFDSGQFLSQLGSLSAGTGLAHIHLEHFRQFQLRQPPINEQKELFKIVREQQQLLNRMKTSLDKLKLLKTSLMQDLLTGKIRVTPLLDAQMEATT